MPAMSKEGAEVVLHQSKADRWCSIEPQYGYSSRKSRTHAKSDGVDVKRNTACNRTSYCKFVKRKEGK